MFTFVLIVRLYADGPIVEVPVKDCDAGVVWIHDAWSWAKRTRMPETGPIYACRPADFHLEARR
jgi:hypothetical protein